MNTTKGHADEVMMSLFTAEASYDAGVTMNNTNACSLKSFECEVDWPDKVQDDKDVVSGKEFGTDQEITEQMVDITYKEPRCRPNTLAGLGELILGTATHTQEGGFTSYVHKITPVAVGTALKSIQLEHKKGGIQYYYRGVKGASLKLSGEAGGYLSLEAALKGSGTRASSATAMANAVTESWLKLNRCKVWMENGANISIAAVPTQAVENISSATPDDLKIRLKSFSFGFDNSLELQTGFGGVGVAQDADFGRRKMELSFSLLFNDAAEIAYFTGQEALAIEFNLTGASKVDAGGANYYGCNLRIPRFKLKKAPLPKGGPNDILTCDFDCDIQDDGTNTAVELWVYNAKAAYLA